jgi:hypothetical protein
MFLSTLFSILLMESINPDIQIGGVVVFSRGFLGYVHEIPLVSLFPWIIECSGPLLILTRLIG